jgi:hypothetical protein
LSDGETPTHRVSSSIGMPIDVVQTVAATVEAPIDGRGLFKRVGRAVRGFVTGTGRPHDGLEPPHRHDEIVGVASVLLPVALLVAIGLGWRR